MTDQLYLSQQHLVESSAEQHASWPSAQLTEPAQKKVCLVLSCVCCAAFCLVLLCVCCGAKSMSPSQAPTCDASEPSVPPGPCHTLHICHVKVGPWRLGRGYHACVGWGLPADFQCPCGRCNPACPGHVRCNESSNKSIVSRGLDNRAAACPFNWQTLLKGGWFIVGDPVGSITCAISCSCT